MATLGRLRFMRLHEEVENKDKTAKSGHPTLRAEQQAVSRLRFLAAKRPSQEQLQQLLRDDVTLTPAARRRARELDPHFK